VAAAGGGAAGEAGLVPVEGAKLRLSLEPDDDDHDDDGDDDDGSAGTGPPTSFEPREATSGADGRFEITGLEAGKTFRLAADAPDRALLVLCIEIEEEASGTRFDLGDLVLDAPAALTVLVLDAEGEPVDGAHVRISPSGDLDKPVSHRLSSWFDGREAEVQGPGEYRFDRLGPGLHDVRCMAPGFTPPEHQEIALPRPEPLKIRLARGRLLAGRVLTSSGAPLAGAVVCIHNSWESPRELARSDAAGRFLLPGKDRGFMDTIEVRAPGFHKYSKDFHQGVDDVEIVLFRETTLSGRVVSALDGRPVARAEVSLETAFPGDDDDDGIDDARTDSEGRFAFRNLPPALYKLKTNHGEYIPAELGPLAAEEGAAVEDVIIKVVPGFALPGRVLDAGTGAAVPAARVSVNFRAERFGPSVLRSASTGPDGAFRLAAPARGKYYVTVKARDYLKFVAESFLSEEPARLDIELTKGGAIAGSVLDPDGRPVARADVLLAVPRDAPDEVKPDDMPLIRTDGAGRFRFGGLPRFPR
jgi:hypothetical protein